MLEDHSAGLTRRLLVTDSAIAEPAAALAGLLGAARADGWAVDTVAPPRSCGHEPSLSVRWTGALRSLPAFLRVRRELRDRIGDRCYEALLACDVTSAAIVASLPRASFGSPCRILGPLEWDRLVAPRRAAGLRRLAMRASAARFDVLLTSDGRHAEAAHALCRGTACRHVDAEGLRLSDASAQADDASAAGVRTLYRVLSGDGLVQVPLDFTDRAACELVLALGARPPQGARCIVTGTGPLEAWMRGEARRTGAALEFAGAQERTDALDAATDVAVAVSDTERVHARIQRLMAAGRPCIGYPVGTLTALVSESTAVAEQPTPDALRNAIAACMADAERREALAVRQRQRMSAAARAVPTLDDLCTAR